jgi:hypothetical protein
MFYSDDHNRHDRPSRPPANSFTFAIICIYIVVCVLIGAAIDARRHLAPGAPVAIPRLK